MKRRNRKKDRSGNHSIVKDRENTIIKIIMKLASKTDEKMLEQAYAGVITIGLLHGLEPGHGWPVAFLYSTRTSRPMFYGFISSSMIAFFHFISSIAVVLAYVLFSSLVNVSISFMKYVGAAMLIVLAYRFFTMKVEDVSKAQHDHIHKIQREIKHRHEHEHPGRGRHTHWHKHEKTTVLSLLGIATFAFVLGFAHEEEFALLGLAVGGVNPLTLMVSYGLSVTLAIISITLVSIKAYESIQPKLRRYEKYIPKTSALILLIMAIALVLT